MLPTLYEIATEFSADAAKLQELDLEEATLADTLEGLQGDLQVKAQNTAMVVRNLEAMALAIQDAERRMAERRKAIENRAKAIRAYIQRCMEHAGIHRIDTPMLALSIRKNPPAVVVDAPSQVPAKFWRIPPVPPAEVDKQALKVAISAGEEVSGAHLEQSTRLEIR